ncbi:MAG: MFS transporter [Acidimicrobiales bacterium]
MTPMRRLNVTAVALYLALGTMFASVPPTSPRSSAAPRPWPAWRSRSSSSPPWSRARSWVASPTSTAGACSSSSPVRHRRAARRHARRPVGLLPCWRCASVSACSLSLLHRRRHHLDRPSTARPGLGGGGAVDLDLPRCARPTLGDLARRHRPGLASCRRRWPVAGAIVWGIPEARPAADATPAPDPGAFESYPAPVPVPPTVPAPPPGTRLWLGVLHPAAVLPGLTLLTLGLGYQAITSQSALYATSIDMATATPLFAAFALSILGIRLVSGRLADTIGPVRVMFPGVACYIVGFGLLARFAAPVAAVVGIAFVGAGWALVFPAVTAWLSGRVPDAERGSALGSLISFMDIGQGTGGYLVGGLADAFGFGTAFVAPAVLAAAGGIVLAVAVRRPGPTAPGGS